MGDIQQSYEEELKYLERTLDDVEKQIQQLQSIPRYTGSDLTEQVLESIRETQRQRLAISQKEPYFARLDFQGSDVQDARPIYIGKVGMEHQQTGELTVIDWRAPIASLFYTFTGGDEAVSYESPEGAVEGLVWLKRIIVIRKQILQRVVDSYVRGQDAAVVTDEFLLYRLEESKDNRLRDIVSTIQQEQDRIIRSAKNQSLIIQGVAGSGKTTVALHRLAYLLYQYREQVRADRMVIFAPNRMFLDYISGVLPELGVGDIQQTTFSDFVLGILNDKLNYEERPGEFEQLFTLDLASAPGRVKGSREFSRLIDGKLKVLEANFVPDESFKAWDGERLDVTIVRSWFYEEYRHYPLGKRLERVQARIRRWLEMQLDEVRDPSRKKSIRKQASTRLRAYFKKWPALSPRWFYTVLMGDDESLALIDVPPEIRKVTRNGLRKSRVNWEDLAPLLYLHIQFYGTQEIGRFDHVVIDEAQDISPFMIKALDLLTKGHSFSILGDLTQGIHEYRGILDWDEIRAVFEEEDTDYFELTRSYRSTMEIIQFANSVKEQAGISTSSAIPVFRSGEKVQVEPLLSEIDWYSRVNRLFERYDTVAVMTRTAESAREWHNRLETLSIQAVLIDGDQREYTGGLSVLPVYLSKGLEFDAVLLMDVDASHYGLTERDGKLLYVGCTRALHELQLYYTGEMSPLIVGEKKE